MSKTFLRRIWSRYSKLGRGRKNKQKWRKPKGRDNKMREKRRGYPAVVSKGYRTDVKSRGKINEKTPVVVYNLNDIKNLGKDSVAIIGRVGMKKKMELMKELHDKKIHIQNPVKKKSMDKSGGKK